MIAFRNATLVELRTVLDWAADEGWNPGLDDAKAFYAADPNGFFLAVDGSDRPLAAISVVNHNAQFAFLGLYIVRPEHRGQGVGLALWNHAMCHAGDRTVGLDGVEEQQENYVASGFSHAGATTRFAGTVEGRDDPDIEIAKPTDIPSLITQEAEATGTDKSAYLSAWFARTDHRITLTIRERDTIAGFCTVRACQSGSKIGPLVAATPGTAHRLIAHAAQQFEGPVTLDVPDSATALSGLCESLGLEAGFRTARMYRGAFAVPRPAVFAVTSLELG